MSGDCSRPPQVALSAGPTWTQTNYLRQTRFKVISLPSNQHLNECELTLQSMFLISNCTRSFPITSKVSKSKVLWLITVLRELTKFIGSIEYLRLLQAGYIQML